RETSVAGHLKTNNIRILDAALPPAIAISPNVPRAALVALMLALVLGIGLSLMLEWFDSAVHTQEDVETPADLVFLGLIPRIVDERGAARNGASKDLFVLEHPKSSI